MKNELEKVIEKSACQDCKLSQKHLRTDIPCNLNNAVRCQNWKIAEQAINETLLLVKKKLEKAQVLGFDFGLTEWESFWLKIIGDSNGK